MAYKSVNPYDGQVLKTFDELGDAQLEAALARAEQTYETVWSTKTFAEKAAVVKKAASILREKMDDFARLVTLEMGKRSAEAQGEVKLSADILDYYADNAERFLAPERLTIAEGEAFVESDPIGVIFGIEPWNFPYYQLARIIAPNLMVGNVVMVKHASNVPQCAAAFEQLFRDAGAPEGAYTNLFITKEQIAHLIADPRIKGVALTGSEAAGATVAAEAGKNLKKTTMELGGSDAFIVLEDADLGKAVEWAVWGRMNNTGQCCVAAKRIIVVDEIADDFLMRFKSALEKLEPGDPLDSKTTLGPLCSEAALNGLLNQVNTAIAHGATVLLGGKRIDRPGAFCEASILTDIKHDNPANKQEFFGPVALFFRVKDEHEAIAIANDSPYGLGGSVFTRDIERGKRVARKIETGMVFINQATWTSPELPFGGIKNSGYGHELSDMGIQEFVNKKLVRVSYAMPV
jgi:succinate-semialdehyde dehydrogenase/glutarate-semialdehyde dehydrogenase